MKNSTLVEAEKIDLPLGPTAVGEGRQPEENTDDAFAEPVLVVIDMQPGFRAANDAATIFSVKAEIEKAIARGLGILVVEYDAHEEGETHPQIMEKLAGYDRAFVVAKATDDGSEEVFEATIENGLWPENYIICGVNSDSCVLETVRGLTRRFPGVHITLPQDACNADSGKDGEVWSEVYARMANVSVLKHGY